MKHLSHLLFIITLFLGFTKSSQAQYVTIPDTNFLKVLVANYPGALLGNQLDTTNIDIVNETSFTFNKKFVRDAEGIQYFDNLQTLNCSNNLIHSFTKLPPNLVYLDCSINQLDSLPELPTTLQSLQATRNNLKTLPSFPNLLTTVVCDSNTLVKLPALNNVQQLYVVCNQIDTLPTLPATLISLNCASNHLHSIPTLPSSISSLTTSNNPIHNLPVLPSSLSALLCINDSLSSLPTLPFSLKYLYCDHNQISNLPTLPSALIQLNCSYNILSSLPTLPNSIQKIYCIGNLIMSLPTLPTSLTHLNCSDNLLTTLPSLPSLLYFLNCGSNSIPALPTLPLSLEILDYSSNPITALPSLPSNLSILYWNNNTTNILPNLPVSLSELYCNNSTIDSLPTLPANLSVLQCTSDGLTFLPILPTSLRYLNFNNNFITSYSPIPPNLYEFQCAGNLITNIPYFPMSTKIINCANNSGITCLPKFSSSMDWINYDLTAITCLPNFTDVVDTPRTSFSLYAMPLCTPATGCPCAWNITGNVHNNISVSCLADSLNPGNRVKNVNMIMLKNSVFTDEIYLTALGEYSFDADINDTVRVLFNTSNLPFNITCPSTGYREAVITITDSLKTNMNFAVECNGIDAGVGAIQGRFRPGQITHLDIEAGSISKFYNVECPMSYSATVTTVFEGPIQYIMPTALALTPNVVSGNVLTYFVPDMSILDVKTAFGIDVITDTGAQLGSPVCIKTTISNVLADTNPSNNEFQICIPVNNSYDPNEKMVSPKDNANPGDKLTYTIFFQNTGNDTAYTIVVKDTLSDNLDMASFKFLASSHDADIEVQGHIVTFHFNHINLLDSNHNEALSHGWLQFTINLKTNLAISTQTYNIAAIYFDLNPPIFTDTATNYIGPDPTYTAPSNPIKLPTAITPNNDGLNDNWHVLNSAYLMQKQLSVQKVIVMNRWGQIVYTDFGNSFSWTPPYSENADVYTYYLIYSTRSGNTHDQHGEITVIH